MFSQVHDTLNHWLQFVGLVCSACLFHKLVFLQVGAQSIFMKHSYKVWSSVF